MHQLKALIWKAYKVRLRSPLTTALDICGPIIIIVVYLCLKLILGSYTKYSYNPSDSNAALGIFRNQQNKPLDPRADLQYYFCNKILYHQTSTASIAKLTSNSIASSCNLDLISLSSRELILEKLANSLEERVKFKQAGKDLNKSNYSQTTGTNGCLTLPGSSEVSYQVGLIVDGSRIEIHMTDVSSNPIVYQPFVEESSFNEFTHPQSDLNSGLHLLEICLGNSLISATSSSSNNDNSTLSGAARQLTKLHVKQFPVTAAAHITPALFTMFLLAANLCNVVSTVARVSDDKESGMHHYLRLSGVPASTYWFSHFLLILIHMIVQNLVIAVLLSIPTSSALFDPFYESNITFRWPLLLTYSLSISAHALFVGSFFDRTSQAFLFASLLATAYSMYPLTFLLQWNPYNFANFSNLIDLTLLNPVANFEAVLIVAIAVCTQTNQPLSLGHLGKSIVGGGMNNYSIGFLWLLLIFQIIFWLFLTILIDQFNYSSSRSFKGLIITLLDELYLCKCCLCCFMSPIEAIKTKSSSDNHQQQQNSKNLPPKPKDPNRICCSLRNVSIQGPTVTLANTRGDPLKMSPEQLRKLQNSSNSISKTSQYLINRQQSSPSHHQQRQHHQQAPSGQYRATNSSNIQAQQQTAEEPQTQLGEAMRQHIVWQDTRITLDNLNLDFRFNQVSFVLGQTNLKELFFEALLGLRTIESGYIVLDENKYTSSTLSLVRPNVGYLGEKDIFVNEMNIFENLQLFGSIRDQSYNQYDSESFFILSLLHLSSRRAYLPSALTSRSSRKLALAAAAVGHTKLLLLVEPTLSLRWKPRCQVLNLLKKYKSIRSIIVDTSDIDEAAAFGDRIVLLKDGVVDLDGTPDRLTKKLACGHWLIFEPIVLVDANDISSINNNNMNLRALEKLTSDLFKQDKLERLDTTNRSVYEELLKIDSHHSANSNTNTNALMPNVHRQIVILKIQQSQNSNKPLCQLLNIFAHPPAASADQQQQHNGIHGFRLVELTYESLEDVLVSKMSKALYPALPPDLLLSLSHRTKTTNQYLDNKETDIQISIRKYDSDHQVPKMVSPIFGAKALAILKDRATKRKELLYLLLAMVFSFLIVALVLSGISTNFERQQQSSSRSSPYSLNNNDGDNNGLISRHRRTIAGDSEVNRGLKVNSKALSDSLIDHLFEQRIGFYLLDHSNTITNSNQNNQSNNNDDTDSSSSAAAAGKFSPELEQLLYKWPGNKKMRGIIKFNSNETDSTIVAQILQANQDLPASIIFHDPTTKLTTIAFEPRLVHSVIAGSRAFINYQLSRDLVANRTGYIPKASLSPSSTNITTNNYNFQDDYFYSDDNSDNTATNSNHLPINHFTSDSEKEKSGRRLQTSRHFFPQPWHEIVTGAYVRRFYYGIGFAIAEGIVMGVFVIAPFRHRSESSVIKVRANYWFVMALFDLTISLIQIIGYIVIIILIDRTYSSQLLVAIFIMLLLYKLASLPISYLVSLIAESAFNGFGFIFIFYVTIIWVFSIHLVTFIDLAFTDDKYLHIIAGWLTKVLPISSLVSALKKITHLYRIHVLCEQVPAYIATSSVVDYKTVRQRTNALDKVLVKVQECLANGKMGISLDVWNISTFGILWEFFMMSLFCLLAWTFLSFSERVFGIIARKFRSTKTLHDPLNAIIRTNETNSHSGFKWDREKDRLISEYIRSMNESKFVKQMSSNCIYLRVWLRPLTDQTSVDKRIALIIEPLIGMGQPRNDIQIELKTTLQLFIRIGNETNRHKVDRIKLIEAYSSFAKEHSNTIIRFAIVDWTRENLYKILLHGHYNTKSTSAVT